MWAKTLLPQLKLKSHLKLFTQHIRCSLGARIHVGHIKPTLATQQVELWMIHFLRVHHIYNSYKSQPTMCNTGYKSGAFVLRVSFFLLHKQCCFPSLRQTSVLWCVPVLSTGLGTFSRAEVKAWGCAHSTRQQGSTGWIIHGSMFEQVRK